ncbi:MAG: four helix bundle protein [bacterium]|nr:four helix bundle protein [bacterium]
MSVQDEIIKELVQKTYDELAHSPKPVQTSRVWKDPEGYRYLTSWSNSVLLQYLIRLFTNSLPKSEYRRKAQVDDAGRSVVRNQEEGFKRSTTSEYLEFIGFSQGSLEEVKGDARELTEDGFLPSKPNTSLLTIGLDLKVLNTTLKEVKGFYRKLEECKGKNSSKETVFLYQPLTILYPPLAKVQAQDLTYEIFLELINKTDYLLRKLVESLEKKLASERKGYQIEQARLKDKFRDR